MTREQIDVLIDGITIIIKASGFKFKTCKEGIETYPDGVEKGIWYSPPFSTEKNYDSIRFIIFLGNFEIGGETKPYVLNQEIIIEPNKTLNDFAPLIASLPQQIQERIEAITKLDKHIA